METAKAIVDLLDQEAAAINMTGLINLLPNHDVGEIKRLANDLYMQGQIQRAPVMGVQGRYYVYLSLHVRTTNGYAPPPAVEPERRAITIEEATALLQRAGWTVEPEVVETVAVDVLASAPIQVERRQADRRRLTTLDVIGRWRLAFPLARVVEIIGDSRKQGLSRDQAALAIRMIREHIKPST